MRRFVQRFPSLVTRNLLSPPTILRHPKTNPRLIVPSLNRVTSRFVFFSSESRSDEVVSKEELKKRIQSFLDDGDEDALPDLFEAMMNRKLSGKHDESDDEVMEEVRKYPINDAHKVDDNNVLSDDGDSSDSDVENDGDLSDGDWSDSDEESDGDWSDSDEEIDGDSPESGNEIDDLRDGGGSSDSDIEFDDRKGVDLSGPNIKINGLKDVDRNKIDGLKPDHSDSESV